MDPISKSFGAPCRPVIRIHPQTDPNVLGKFCGSFFRKGLFDHYVAMFEEMINLLGWLGGF